mmetsp:Transcript_91531/g.236256  ORF Transcript_91531/g.236256 Transcript_91531/m.236256 type:complete len:474 (+) Transcript_91531:193-1614(+)
MTERELQDTVEVVPGRLFWVALHSTPQNTHRSHYFSIDNKLVYEPFFADFGPLNLAMMYRYCKTVEAMLADPHLKEKRLIHYCSNDPKKRANSVFLICAYQVIVLQVDADAAFAPFKSLYPPFLPFRDASHGPCTWQLQIQDCLQGLAYSLRFKWFDWSRFDVDSYEFFERVENGDMNWIIPERFLAFAGPLPMSTDGAGYLAFTPEDYVPIFHEASVGLVIRLNKKQYERRRFIDNGIKHVDLYFLDGSCPPTEIVAKFLHICESESRAIAVHCKAGLGRTGTLIGLYAMKHYRIPARAFVGWNRICRPGSILGPQQEFLCDMEKDMFQAGAMMSGPRRSLSMPQCSHLAFSDDDVVEGGNPDEPGSPDRAQSRATHEGVYYTDHGQGERLVGAKLKRNSNSEPMNLASMANQVASEGCGIYEPRDACRFNTPFSGEMDREAPKTSTITMTKPAQDSLPSMFTKGLRGIFTR